MSILGKVLAGLNVLLALLFLCLAGLDRSQRQAWGLAALKHDLFLHGLPVDDKVTDPDGRLLSVNIGPKTGSTLVDVFKLAGGNPVETQVEEVNRRYQELRDEFAAMDNPVALRRRLETVLLNLQDTGGARDTLAARLREAAEVAALKKIAEEELAKAFQSALEGHDSTGKDLDRHQRHEAIARVLLASAEDTDPEKTLRNQQRVLAVVGLEVFTQELERQADRLRDLSDRVQDLRADERTAFETEYKKTAQDVRLLYEQVEALKGSLRAYRELTKARQTAVADREKYLEDLNKQLKQAQEKTQEARREQTKLEKDLFDTQQLIGATLEKNAALEKQLEERESVHR